ncbi:hypothetical protein FSP39_002541 [Pinctada imbricata]|uniref:SWIM-type domain-containing protein n=1 Tax=Pinctada imbricata TaxID=66713 RepID=A0AA88XM88_PINIB|nr:hypothetical protein FSP39_002541 [Pinctada imbricata]
MEPEGLQRLLRTYQSLTDDIDVKGILPFLISKLLISSDDQERIDAEVTRRDKIERLLRILRTKEGSYDIFRKSLEKDYEYLVQKLDKVEIDYEEIRRQHEMVYVRARCVPETRQSSESYKLWVLIEKTGCIHSAECSCVAGDGSCKHVVALLYGLNEVVSKFEDRNDIGVTDVAAYWSKPKRVCRPVEVENLDIRIDTSTPLKRKPSAAAGYTPLKYLDKPKIEKDIKKLLRDTKTNAVALYTLSDSEEDCSGDEIEIQSYPLNIIDLINRYGVEKVYENANQSYIENVCELTKGQSDNDMWYYQRKGRLTASNFHSAIHYKGDNPDNYIVKTVLGKYHFTSEATRYGKFSEPLAREKYGAKMKQSHVSFYCKETGVFVYEKFPFIAASPDGIVNCKCCSQGLVEIKCPFQMKNEMPQDAMAKNSSCVWKDGKYVLKRDLSSPFYVQILGQMAILKLPFCDFVIYTNKGMNVERIPYNPTLWEEMFTKIKDFYNKFILPILN